MRKCCGEAKRLIFFASRKYKNINESEITALAGDVSGLGSKSLFLVTSTQYRFFSAFYDRTTQAQAAGQTT
tara:strand:+ start:256 stop:468 length:213 start_codon:yes stop_codon:yes gene_type:complete